MATLMWDNGVLLFRNNVLAFGPECCCEVTAICCCPSFDALPPPAVRFTVTGYLSGTVTINAEVSDVCLIWEGNVPLDAEKCEFFDPPGLAVELNCTAVGQGTSAITAILGGGGADCGIGSLTQISITCVPKFKAVYSWSVQDLTGSCACPGETGTLTIEEV
jgi:hypothetical protein